VVKVCPGAKFEQMRISPAARSFMNLLPVVRIH
jgi:hypothetical protein